MRTYDPEEDLPPYHTEVYCLAMVQDGFFAAKQMTVACSFDPRIGWGCKTNRITKILKWCDAPVFTFANEGSYVGSNDEDTSD